MRTYLAGGDESWKMTNAMLVFMLLPSLVILTVVRPRVRSGKFVGSFKGV